MNTEAALNLTALVEWYMFASIPGYLYRHFRADATIQNLVRRLPTEILIADYDAHTRKTDRSAEDVTIAYAVLIGLTFLSYRETLAAFDRLDLSRLDWGDEIKSIFQFLPHPAVNRFTFTLRTVPEIIMPAVSPVPTTHVTLSIPEPTKRAS